MHLIISTLFAVLLFTVTPAWADGGGGITFQRMQEQAAKRARSADFASSCCPLPALRRAFFALFILGIGQASAKLTEL